MHRPTLHTSALLSLHGQALCNVLIYHVTAKTSQIPANATIQLEASFSQISGSQGDKMAATLQQSALSGPGAHTAC